MENCQLSFTDFDVPVVVPTTTAGPNYKELVDNLPDIYINYWDLTALGACDDGRRYFVCKVCDHDHRREREMPLVAALRKIPQLDWKWVEWALNELEAEDLYNDTMENAGWALVYPLFQFMRDQLGLGDYLPDNAGEFVEFHFGPLLEELYCRRDASIGNNIYGGAYNGMANDHYPEGNGLIGIIEAIRDDRASFHNWKSVARLLEQITGVELPEKPQDYSCLDVFIYNLFTEREWNSKDDLLDWFQRNRTYQDVCYDCEEAEDNCTCEKCRNCGYKRDWCDCSHFCDEDCEHCRYCNEPEDDCTCERCDYCEEKEQDCTCETCPDCEEKEQDCTCEKCEECEHTIYGCTCDDRCWRCHEKNTDPDTGDCINCDVPSPEDYEAAGLESEA